jgi:putative DNA primase/helicase
MTAHVADFSKSLMADANKAAIREGFTDGRLNAAMHGSRASTMAPLKSKNLLNKWGQKMIERPPYLTEEEFEDAKREAKAQKPRKTRRKTSRTGEVHESDAVSDDGLALAFVDRHGHELRYVAAWGKWLKWTGTHWQIEKTLDVFDKARKTCREAGVKKAKTVSAVEMLSRSDRHVAATVEQWDVDPWALNTPSGIVDLRTGGVRPHDPGDYATKITAAAPDSKCPCPLFKAFLEKIFGGDKQVIGYMQKVFGYALTGVTIEHAMMFFYGTGANGKSVLVSTLSDILGTYHRAASIETFTASNIPRHTADLAALMGARLVTAVETEEGRHWAESKIKTLTGGDKISAQLMRQDYFDFIPAFKLVIAGNHKPGLRSVDEAIRRRFHFVQFNVTIPLEERDEHLARKLQAEWPGILQWAIEGCLRWQANGLTPPKAISDATAAYLESEDAMAAWIEERCECKASFEDTSANLYASWKAWAELMGESAISSKAFGRNIGSRPGIEPTRIGHAKARGYSGIRVIKTEAPLPSDRTRYD